MAGVAGAAGGLATVGRVDVEEGPASADDLAAAAAAVDAGGGAAGAAGVCASFLRGGEVKGVTPPWDVGSSPTPAVEGEARSSQLVGVMLLPPPWGGVSSDLPPPPPILPPLPPPVPPPPPRAGQTLLATSSDAIQNFIY